MNGWKEETIENVWINGWKEETMEKWTNYWMFQMIK